MDRERVPEGLIPSIKAATRALVAACAVQGVSGPQRVADLTGKSAGTISRWQSDAYSDLIPVDVVFWIEFSIQRPVFARALADLTGHRLVAMAEDDAGSVADLDGLTSDLVSIVGSGGRVGAVLGQVLADRRVTPREARDTLAAIGAHEEIIAPAKRRLARIAEGAK